MKIFLRKILAFCIFCFITLILLMGFCFFVVLPQYSQGYCAALEDKMQRLDSLKSPKIVLIGNSNLAFGMDSEELEEAMDMPVVNMGLHGGLGNAFHEQMVYGHVKEGDIIIVCHTSYDDDDTIGDAPLAWTTIENNPELWNLIRPKDYPKMLQALPGYMFDSFLLWMTGRGNKTTEGCYARQEFNAWGDDIYQRTESTYTFTQNTVTVDGVSTACANRLNHLNEYVTNCGGTLLVAAYPIGDGQFTPADSEYNKLQNELESQLTCPVISDFAKYKMDYSYFYNTNFHLTDAGVEIRTQLLISDLKQYLRR